MYIGILLYDDLKAAICLAHTVHITACMTVRPFFRAIPHF